MHRKYVITPRQSGLRSYRKALKEELRSALSEESLKRCPINHQRILDYKARVLGGRSWTNDFADWTEFLLKEYGPKQTSLSLGSGLGRVERYLIKIGFTPSFKAIELNPRCNIMAMDAEERIKAREGDLNFIELEPKTYDFILCHGILHHLINLEHVLEQINCGLKTDGLLLIYEYVGESRWQFSETRLSHLREIFPDMNLKKLPIWKIPGFESIRSGEILGLIKTQFGDTCEKSVNYGGVFFPLIVCNWQAAKKQIKRIVELDAEVSQLNEIPPCYHMGVYHKSTAVLPQPVPWTDEQLKAKLFPSMTVFHRVGRINMNIRNRIRLRTRLRSLLSHLRYVRSDTKHKLLVTKAAKNRESRP
jgi:SAM-dependent methyltransferase